LDVLTRQSSGFAAMGQSQGNKRSEHLALLAPVVREAMRPFARGGVYGDLVDAPVDHLHWGTINTFELEALSHRGEVYPALLEYLFPQLEDLLDGRHTLFDFDEAWNIFSNAAFVDILRKSMPGWRRKNAHGSFYTQSIAQLEGHPLTPFLMESCQTRVFFPNPKALDHKILPLYEGLRLQAEEIETNIAHPPGKGFVYVDRSAGPDDLGSKRLIDVRLSPIARAICGANSEADHDVMDAILAAHDPHEFAYHWLVHQGFPDAALTVQRALDHDRIRTAADLLSVAS
jgi:type IV secretory pathway VirB4 component